MTCPFADPGPEQGGPMAPRRPAMPAAPAVDHLAYMEAMAAALRARDWGVTVEFPGYLAIVDPAYPLPPWVAVLGDNNDTWGFDLYPSLAAYERGEPTQHCYSPIPCATNDFCPAEVVAAWADWRLRYWLVVGDTTDVETALREASAVHALNLEDTRCA